MIIGGTGFLGKIMLYMLLKFVPNIKKVYVVIRPTHSRSAQDRFKKEVLGSPVFSEIKEDIPFFEKVCLKKVELVEGDAVKEMLGLDAKTCETLWNSLDIVLNTAGNVEFNPPIDLSINANTIATKQVLDFTSKTKSKKYVHISTCYVANKNLSRSIIPEENISHNRTSQSDNATNVIDPHLHIENALAEVLEVKERFAKIKKTQSNPDTDPDYPHTHSQTNSQKDINTLEKQARLELARFGNNNPSQRMIDRAIKNLSSIEMRDELIQLGRKRAQEIGCPNVYTYTKTLAELLVQSYSSKLDCVIVRPSIVETAIKYPFPGWNEGIQGTAPLIYLAYRGHRIFPTISDHHNKTKGPALLDCIPVDEVASGTILAACALLRGKNKAIYQLSCGASKSPLTVATFLYVASNLREEAARNNFGVSSWIKRNIQPYPASPKAFNKFSSPNTLSILSKVRHGMDKIFDTNIAKGKQKYLTKVRTKVEKFYQISSVKNKIFKEFLPFIYKGFAPFQNKNAVLLHSQLITQEKDIFHFNPAEIDYLNYASDLHVQSLKRWIFPVLEKRFNALEKIGNTTKNHESDKKTNSKNNNNPQTINNLVRSTIDKAQVIVSQTIKKTKDTKASIKNEQNSYRSKNNNTEKNLSSKPKDDMNSLVNQLECLNDLGNEKISSLKESEANYLKKLSSHLEFIYGARISPEALVELNTVPRLYEKLKDWNNELSPPKTSSHKKIFPQEGLDIPELLREPSSDFLYSLQMGFCRNVLRAKVSGQENIPLNNNHIIIVSNHNSHLDYGLVWYSLGKYGRNMGIVAARDYFFDTFLKSTLSSNFLNLVPIEREVKGGYAKALAPVLNFLNTKGAPLLLFPEGTRSTNGQLQPFRLGLGYLIDHSDADVLPIRIYNTHNALPKGKRFVSFKKNAQVRVKIGRLISNEYLKSETSAFTPTKTYHYLSQKIFTTIKDME